MPLLNFRKIDRRNVAAYSSESRPGSSRCTRAAGTEYRHVKPSLGCVELYLVPQVISSKITLYVVAIPLMVSKT
jgi:hypothetical protein